MGSAPDTFICLRIKVVAVVFTIFSLRRLCMIEIIFPKKISLIVFNYGKPILD